MPLHLIIGPMKSGKSLELINITSPYCYSKHKIKYYQPAMNAREANITSRAGLSVNSIKFKKLKEININSDVIVIDEVHMLTIEDVEVIKNLLLTNIIIYLSGLDLDYRGKLMPIVKLILELKPDSITLKKAVCDNCHIFNASYTQILENNIPVTKGLPSIVVDNGKFLFQARCRRCFVTN